MNTNEHLYKLNVLDTKYRVLKWLIDVEEVRMTILTLWLVLSTFKVIE